MIDDSEILYYDTGAEVKALAVASYPDQTPIVAFDDYSRSVRRVLLRPRSLQSLMTGLAWIEAMSERGRERPELVLPFIPGARQDRLNDSGDYLFTVKTVARAINALNLPRVIVLDPHSDVGPALIDRCRVIHADRCVSPPPKKYQAVISPDGGAEKRAGRVARKLGVPLIHGWKSRRVDTGAISGFGIEPIPADVPRGSLVLVVDDICDGGGTFLGLADAIDAAGLKAHLWVTHGLFSQGTAGLLQRYGHVYCTDSVIASAPDVIRVRPCEALLQGGSI